MEHVPIIPPQQPIQVLITACSSFGPPPDRCAWLNGFCLLTLRPDGTPMLAGARVRTGERHGNDRPLIQELTRSLNPTAQLVGLDLTANIGRLGRLPIDAEDQGPALALLDRLEAMVRQAPPTDLSLSPQSRTLVAQHAHEQQLGIAEPIGDGSGKVLFGVVDNGNPAALALAMAETAQACAMAVVDERWPSRLAALQSECKVWREKLVTKLSRTGD